MRIVCLNIVTKYGHKNTKKNYVAINLFKLIIDANAEQFFELDCGC